MPTVARFAGLRVEVYTNDHRPAHVHVNGRGQTAVFELNCPAGPPLLREVCGFSLAELNQVLRKLATHLPHLCQRWRDIHGHYH
jgi:hypothetical protein